MDSTAQRRRFARTVAAAVESTLAATRLVAVGRAGPATAAVGVPDGATAHPAPTSTRPVTAPRHKRAEAGAKGHGQRRMGAWEWIGGGDPCR